MAVARTDLVTIGRVERPFGVKGEVKVRSLSDVPGRFEHLGGVTLVAATGQATERTVSTVRKAGSGYLVKFDGVATPEEAGSLRGSLIQIPQEHLPARSENSFYECDLVGMAVVDETGTEVGRVQTTWELPGHHVFVVQGGGREILIPAARSFVTSVDLAHRRMVVRGIGELVEESHAV